MSTDQETEIFAKVQEICAKQLECEIDVIKQTSSFGVELQADSLDLVELVMSFEEEFDIEIADEVAGEMTTVQDAVDYIKKIKNKYTPLEK